MQVIINIPVGLCVLLHDLNGKEMMGRFERVPRGVIEILNSLLREGVRVQSFTYVRHRWEKKRDSFSQRKTRELQKVKASDFKEWKLAVGGHSRRRRR